jgi:hypothetical protein
MAVRRTKWRALTATLSGVFSMFLGLCAAAQDGHYGVDHDKWHHEFYATLKRKDGSGMPCCNQNDCRPKRKAEGSATIMRSRSTADGCRCLNTRLSTWSRRTAAPTYAHRNRMTTREAFCPA